MSFTYLKTLIAAMIVFFGANMTANATDSLGNVYEIGGISVANQEFALQYDEVKDTLGATFTLPSQNDSWWMVLTDGEIPNNGVQLIGDAKTGKITAYTYTGGEENAYKQGQYLGTFGSTVTPDNKVKLNIDLSEVNGFVRDNNGTPFAVDETSGLWFKGGANSEFQYNTDGSIASYTASSFNNLSDFRNRPTYAIPYTPSSSVSEPAGLLVIFTVLSLFCIKSRSKVVA